MNRALYVLGTGHAMVTRLYNTCFALREGEAFFLLDAGGGNGILRVAEDMGLPWEGVGHLFLSHAHTDHILGGLWVIRAVGGRMLSGAHGGVLRIWSHPALLETFSMLCRTLLSPELADLLGRRILLCPVSDGQTVDTDFGAVSFFDTGCASIRQFGCSVLRGGDRLTYLGDEPIRPVSRPYTQGCDWLIAEAMCLYSERAIHRPYECLHGTVRDTCRTAEALEVKNLILCHTEDTHGSRRKERYIREGARWFHGQLLVPDDGEVLPIP